VTDSNLLAVVAQTTDLSALGIPLRFRESTLLGTKVILLAIRSWLLIHPKNALLYVKLYKVWKT
jgi:hypothetical protein